MTIKLVGVIPLVCDKRVVIKALIHIPIQAGNSMFRLQRLFHDDVSLGKENIVSLALTLLLRYNCVTCARIQ